MAFRYLHLDVFPASPGGGNHLGVVVDAAGWADAAMQRFARWSNLVETTFLVPPTQRTADYRVRIFTPRKEIPFAGHPSIGSAHAVLACGIASPRGGVLRQECGAGVLPIRITRRGPARRLLLRAPPSEVVHPAPDSQALLARALVGVGRGKLPPALVAGGRKWWIAEIADEAALRGWQPDHGSIAALASASQSMGLCVFVRRAGDAPALAVRAFPAGAGIVEDPASGAANGLLAAYLAGAEPAGPYAHGYTVSQGREMGHDAELVVRIEAGGIWVGGRARTVIDGTLDWDAN